MSKSVVFLHPDLGIGGAERLVIDAAVGLQNRGHKVTIFTSHCDPKHCFDEARDGTLDVRVRGNTLIPPSLFSRLSILCAILRQLHLVLSIAVLTNELASLQPTHFFLDQLSACIPLLRFLAPRKTRILFYCHFPDKLLVREEKGGGGWAVRLLQWGKKGYRVPFDWVEEWSTGTADGIVVNSRFTRGVFRRAFPGLKKRVPGVVYPCVDTGGKKTSGKAVDGGERVWQGKKVVLSINRFERKKDVGLAVRAYAGLKSKEREGTRLVVAGGYDPRISENVAYHKDLVTLAESFDLRTATAQNVVSALSIPSDIDVLFLLSVPNQLKSTLLSAARLLLYTPQNEHFGIVPLEAMLAGLPVLAANSGGPTETVVDGKTGWLRSADQPDEWTEIIAQALHGLSDQKLREMGNEGAERVARAFSQDTMAQTIDDELEKLDVAKRPSILTSELIYILAIFGAIAAALLWFIGS
ncbi:glycosyltransferase family 4 protein [Viridothelium virens]|uniref:Alpha-1,3/1,6-mannosyltransferase ALG2 n=1 Tax=Viridothelium virens TaxID=1048519 RepID=A0A6A6HQB0_VIRVR|nr:glycosyltransferase family 4 protein [Viridothelium virens]